jgi:SAM-dependent methyltransferase
MPYTAFDRFVAWRRFQAALPYIRQDSHVCDVGCGIDAAFLRYAQSRILFGLGLDYRAPGRFAKMPVALVRCDIKIGIPARSGRFDHAVMLAVLEHLEKPRPLLEDIFRTLKPGGSLIMTWPQAVVDPILDLLHHIGLVSREMESGKHQARMPVAQLISLLMEVGFRRFTHKRFEFGLNNLLVCYKFGPI